ncbi:hypothetical protein K4F52_003299 [Lecanicillium sp. MT-2017a]|nr:hypothetical protein K4F52_003299 [Lecanicillium sp. MT-2017a]
MAKTPEESRAGTDAASGDASNAPAKRGRGRPPKDGVKKAPYVPTGRPRGRPKSDNPKTYVPTGRPRGRPKGSVKSPATAPKPSSGRGRGRPRKSEGAEDDKAAGDEGGAKRAKGRPRKSEAADDGDAAADGNDDAKDETAKEAEEPKRKRARASRGAEA